MLVRVTNSGAAAQKNFTETITINFQQMLPMIYSYIHIPSIDITKSIL